MVTAPAPMLLEPVDSMHAESVTAVRAIRAESARLRMIASTWAPRPYPGSAR